MRTDPYSRFIFWVRILLPLLALAALSTLFLLSRNKGATSQIPFAEREITERIKGQQVTQPIYTGATADGDQITFTADDVTTGDGNISVARTLSTRVDFVSGSHLTLTADEGFIDLPKDIADMQGHVTVVSSTGYVMRSATLSARLSRLEINVPTQVTATGPAGSLVAGAMNISSDERNNNTHLLFTGGVKLIYEPKDRNK